MDEQLRRRSVGAPAARSLLLTVLGEYVLPRSDSVWQETLVGALQSLGYTRQAARQALQQIADALPVSAWKRLERPLRYQVKTRPRRRPPRVKEQIVRERAFENLRLRSEDVAEFDYQPTACDRSYRMVVVRKNLSKEKG